MKKVADGINPLKAVLKSEREWSGGTGVGRLKPVSENAPGNGLVSPTHEDRPRVAFAVAPLAIVVAVAFVSFAGRTYQNATRGLMNATESLQAKAVASSVLSRLTDQPIPSQDLQFSELTAFSVRHNVQIKEWNVSQDVEGQRQYLFRINAATGRVYAINRGMSTVIDPEISRSEPRHTVSADQARMLAIHYLKINGVEPNSVTMIDSDLSTKPSGEDLPFASEDYAMSFRRHVPGVGNRTLKIGVSRLTGELEYYWNPSAAM